VKLCVSIFDEVKKGDNKAMGSAVFDLASLLAARGCTNAKRLPSGGVLHAHVRKSEGSGILRLQMQGQKLTNTEGFMRKSDPFFELSRRVDVAGGLTWDNVVKSEVVNDNLSPQWKEVAIELGILCGGNLESPIRVRVFDYESKGGHVLMGEFETNVRGLVAAAQSNTPFTMKKKNNPTGTIFVAKADVSGVNEAGSLQQGVSKMSLSAPVPMPASNKAPFASRPNFVDYVSGGCELNVVIGIDFTGSNGDPRKPGTLHHIDDYSLNDYEKAISSIVGILSEFDSDKKFPVLGFGAKYGGVVRHCFQCGASEQAVGLEGVLSAYRSVFNSGLIMSSPTDITEVIQTAAARAESSLDSALRSGRQTYTILLVVTDGAVSDIQATARCIEQVHDAPLSIVIVGVGNADFSGMRFLDDLRKPGKRDIVQFVPFNQHSRDPTDLSSVTLDEIPGQLVDFFQARKIAPMAARTIRESMVFVGEESEIDLSLSFREEEIVVSSGGRDFKSW